MDDEDLDIPPYAHPQLRERRMDDATRRITLIAGGLGIGVILVAIGWNGYHAGLGPPPVVKPLATPMRTIPVNRGGLQVPGANEPILSGAPPSPPHLAPPPPSPDLAPLEAAKPISPPGSSNAPSAAPAPLSLPLPPARAPVAPRTATGAAPSAQSPATASSSATEPTGRSPSNPPLANPPTTNPSTANTAARANIPKPVVHGPAAVQLAALPSQAGAMQAWQTLVARVPTILGGLTPHIVSGQVHGQTYYRVRLNFASPADAAAFCARLHARSVPCYQPH
jgi:hypothetical protein